MGASLLIPSLPVNCTFSSLATNPPTSVVNYPCKAQRGVDNMIFTLYTFTFMRCPVQILGQKNSFPWIAFLQVGSSLRFPTDAERWTGRSRYLYARKPQKAMKNDLLSTLGARDFSSAARGFGLRPKMCRPSANTENSRRTPEKPLVPRVLTCTNVRGTSVHRLPGYLVS